MRVSSLLYFFLSAILLHDTHSSIIFQKKYNSLLFRQILFEIVPKKIISALFVTAVASNQLRVKFTEKLNITINSLNPDKAHDAGT